MEPVGQSQARCYVLSTSPGGGTSQSWDWDTVMFGQVRQIAALAAKLRSAIAGLFYKVWVAPFLQF